MCDAAKFREQPHTRRSLVDRTPLPPYHTVYVDGFGGQQKFKVRSMSGNSMPDSFHGAKGGYVFCCAETDAIDVRLAASKAQFPRLLRSYLRAVQIDDYVVRVIVLDNAAEFMSQEVEDILDEYDVMMQPASPYTPQGNSLAENAVQIVCRIGRALMLGAPHLPSNRWGLAVKYACHINLVLPKKRLGGKTPYERIKGRIPDLRRLYYKVFGAPLVYKVGGKAQQQLSAIDSRVADGHFVGIDRPSVLVDTGDKIVARAMTKVKVYQGRYCEIDSAGALDQVHVEKEDGIEEEIPVALPSVRSVRDAYDHIDQGENDIEEEVYDEDNLEIDKPEVQVQLKDKVNDKENEEEEKQSESEEEEGSDSKIVEQQSGRKRKKTVRFDPGVDTSAKKWKSNAVIVGKDASRLTAKYMYMALEKSGGDREIAERLEPYRTLRTIVNTMELREMYENNVNGMKYPKTAREALVKEDWRQWVEAIRKEARGWTSTNTYQAVKWNEMERGSPIIQLG